MRPITQDSIVEFCGSVFNMEQFAAKYADGNVDVAIGAVEKLRQKGKVKVMDGSDSKEQKIFDAVQKEIDLVEKANEYDREAEEVQDARAEQKRNGRATYPEIELDYPTKTKLFEHKRMFMKNLRLVDDQFDIVVQEHGFTLKILNITDAELNFIQKTYNADRIIGSAVGVFDSGAQKATSAVAYTAEKIISPAATVAAKAGASLAKTSVKTGVKVLATVFSSLTKGLKEAATEVSEDADVLRAGRELINTKDSIMRKVSSFGGATGGKGIRIKTE
jgi:hypothetical protein